ncbi:putative serine/threonine-protein kinase At1g54610 isoform X3 [Silene latifolia]|uniref:putative serine/threonine-protein kinase At1g54610 isoform X3 n=1 Tax=Silene latifolia TaxID=37657 RepID=UPI003D77ABDE
MGCVSTKPYVTEDDIRRPLERTQSKRLSRASSCREGNPPLMNRSDSRSLLIDRQTNRSIRLNEDNFEKTRVKPDDDALANFSSIRMIPKGQEAELVAAGWPSWLASAAGEAISGWIPRRSDSFERLDKIGEGTYSSVYRARDLIRGNIVALKRVRFDNLDRESVKFMAREILILRRLDHPNIIKLDGLITSNTSTSLYLIFEYMEHDLTGLSSLPGLQFTEPQVKCFMQQLLSGLDHCHSRGVLHRDIKGSNLLINESGILKIADFGLATFFDPQKSLPLTSRVVTLWYRPPELLLGATHYGVAVDLWSAGCILGELYTGKPIMPGRTEFFTTEPFACDPSTLPEYPPSKEIDARKREEETKRHQALENKRDRVDQIKQGSQESAASLSAKVNAEFVSSLQKKKSQSQAKPRQELFRPCRHDSTLGPIFDLSRNTQDVKEVSKEIFDRLHQRGIYSGPLTGGKGWSNADEKRLDSSSFSRLPNLTTLSSLAPNRTLASGDNSGSHGSLQNKKATDATGRFPVTTSDLDRIRNDNLLHSDYPQYEENTCTRRSALHSYAPNDERIHFSGPLPDPSKDLDWMLKEHDLRIHEAARRARFDKFKHGKVLVR